MKYKIYFLLISFISLLLFFGNFIFLYKILFLPFLFFFLGIAIRVIFKSNFLTLFSFLFPISSAFAFIENKGFAFNYLLLPLIMLAGIYVAEIILSKNRAMQVLENLNYCYLLLLTLIFVSFIFVMLRWSNLTLLSRAFLKDTPVAPQGLRLSFGILFPINDLFLFQISYIYFLYLSRIENKRKIIIAFLMGHSLSIGFSLIQNIFNVRLFFTNPYNGLTSDVSSFGFLCALSFLLSLYLYYKHHDKFYGITFMIVSIFGILNSKARIGLIVILFAVIYVFFKMKKRARLIFIIFVLIGFCDFIYLIYNPKISGRLQFLDETRRNIENVQEYLVTGKIDDNSLRTLLSGRELLWDYSINIIKKYPLTGIGVGNFVFWVMYAQFEKEYYHDLSSNQYLFFSSAIGVFGILIFVAFLYNLGANKRGLERWLFFCIVLILFFYCYFWIPESFLAFWLLCSLNSNKVKHHYWKKKYFFIGSGMMVAIFIFFNIYHFNSLHPKNWALETKTLYDYGFWYKEKDLQGNIFYWTKEKAGIYLYLDRNGFSNPIKLVCGAPLEKLQNRHQKIELFWKGKTYKRFLFMKNKELIFSIKGNPNDQGFFELRVTPTFNLKKMKISEETRDLGIQFYYPW